MAAQNEPRPEDVNTEGMTVLLERKEREVQEMREHRVRSLEAELKVSRNTATYRFSNTCWWGIPALVNIISFCNDSAYISCG